MAYRLHSDASSFRPGGTISENADTCGGCIHCGRRGRTARGRAVSSTAPVAESQTMGSRTRQHPRGRQRVLFPSSRRGREGGPAIKPEEHAGCADPDRLEENSGRSGPSGRRGRTCYIFLGRAGASRKGCEGSYRAGDANGFDSGGIEREERGASDTGAKSRCPDSDGSCRKGEYRSYGSGWR